MVSALVVGTLLLSGCFSSHIHSPRYFGYVGDRVTSASCVLIPTEGSTVSGWVMFQQREEGGVLVTAEVDGLTPGEHGFHLHERGDIRGGSASGCAEIFNPAGQKHASPEHSARKVGDLGNLVADENGHASYSRVDTQLHLFGPHSVVGRGIVIHANPDDFRTQPDGNSGPAIAVGTVGIASVEQEAKAAN